MDTVKNLRLLLVCLIFLVVGCNKAKVDGEVAAITIDYQESLDIFSNPERGFIHNLDVHSEGEGLNTLTLTSLKNEYVSMIMRMYYIEDFKDKLLSAKELSLISTDMQKLRQAGIKCVMRFAYTDFIGGTDAPLTIISQHLDQLQPIFEENEDVIAFVQAGFIGAWGEWHSSSNGLATTDNERKVLNKLLSVLPSQILVQVRTPGAKQQIFSTTVPIDAGIAYTSDNRARVGYHNDCFLSGGTDYGTYLNILADKEYISKEALYVPTGGETCPPVEGGYPDCQTSKTEMKLLKWTYLNLDWYKPMLDLWRNSGCFSEFQRLLGYRLVLVNAKLPQKAVLNQDYKVEMTITNKGFAPLYNYKNTNMVFKNRNSGEIYSVKIPVDLRDCKPNGTLNISNNISLAGIPQGDYDLYLSITDQSDKLKNKIEYSIQLANLNCWDKNSGMNNLKHMATIAAN